MKHLKTLGLAAIAALALIAFVGAGTASAETTSCKVTEDPCGEANMYPVGTEIHAILKAGTESVFKSGFGTWKCKASTFRGKTATTTTPEANLEAMTFEECNCPITVIKPGKFQIHWDVEHNGTLTFREFEWKVGGEGITCFLINNFECIYSGEITGKLTVFGGNPATIKATEAVVPRTGGKSGEAVCGRESKWTAEYEITSPKPLYVSKGL